MDVKGNKERTTYHLLRLVSKCTFQRFITEVTFPSLYFHIRNDYNSAEFIPLQVAVGICSNLYNNRLLL